MNYNSLKALKALTSFHIQNPTKKNIMIFSTARSGSTWLMELIAASGKIKVIDEPFLFSKYADEYYPLERNWNALLPRQNREQEIKKYFNHLINNKSIRFIPSIFNPKHSFITDRILFKILRTKDMINWYEKEFDAKIVYLLRHPIPTSLSRDRYGRLPLFLGNKLYKDKFLTRNQVTFANSIVKHGNELQKKSLDWAIQNLPAINFSDKSNWQIIYYEDLVLNPIEILEKTSNYLEFITINRKMKAAIYKASGSTHLSESKTQEVLNDYNNIKKNRLFLINKWQNKVSRDDEEKVFEILNTFNISDYTLGNPLPNN